MEVGLQAGEGAVEVCGKGEVHEGVSGSLWEGGACPLVEAG